MTSISSRASYIATAPMEKKVPKYQVKIEVSGFIEKSNTIEQHHIAKSTFMVFEEDSSVMRATNHALFMISKELGDQTS